MLSDFAVTPEKYAGEFKYADCKHTYSERKGKTFEVYNEHISEENYDRKIWMARDPRHLKWNA